VVGRFHRLNTIDKPNVTIGSMDRLGPVDFRYSMSFGEKEDIERRLCHGTWCGTLKGAVSLCLTKWRGEQTEIFYGPRLALGNTGVTKMRVVERGALRRDGAREDFRLVVRWLRRSTA
jgi:hypothetical protein